MLQTLAHNLSSPLVHAPLIFIGLRLIYIITKRNKIAAYASLLPIVWFTLCSMTYPSSRLVAYLEDTYPVVSIEDGAEQQIDVIVVLACNHFAYIERPFVSKWPACALQRNLHAALMYQQHPTPIYFSGGIMREGEASQSTYNKGFLQKLGVNLADLHEITEGTNTESEVKALAGLLKGKKIALISAAYHLPRALKYFELANADVLPIPVEHLARKNASYFSLPNSRSLYRSERAIHEYLGLIKQRFFSK